MTLRDELLAASKAAREVIEDGAAHKRVQEDGYTRIDPVTLAERAGVAVMFRPMDRLLGAFVREGETGILVNPERPIGMVHMTCAHELGHFHLGHQTRTDENIDYPDTGPHDEQAADQFAYSLLAPRWLIKHVMDNRGWGARNLVDPQTIYQLSLRLGISYTAMVWTLRRLKLLSSVVAGRLARVEPKTLKVSALPAGQDPPSGTDVWLLDPQDRDSVIEARPEDRFVLRLPSHVSAGYVWTAEEASSAGFSIQPVLVDARTKPKASQPLRVGVVGMTTYLVDPKPDTVDTNDLVTLRLQEAQPWRPQSAVNDHFQLKARYESLSQGLSTGTKRRVIEQAR
jgi:Zn-dependent peptidase ImmA (M78 family)